MSDRTPEEEWAWVQRAVKLEEERGPIVLNGAVGGGGRRCGWCGWCGRLDHAPDDCPNRTKCAHGVYEDLEDNGIPRCMQCAIE